MVFIFRNFLHREDLRASCQHGHFHIIVDIKVISHLFKAVHIFLCKRLVIFEEYLCVGIILVCHKYIYFSSLDIIL